MNKSLTIEIPEDIYKNYQEIAENKGESTETIVLEYVITYAPRSKKDENTDSSEAEKRFARWIGAVSSGNPRSADNEQIDADLAEEYGRGL